MTDLKEREEKALTSVKLGQWVLGCHHLLFECMFLINKVKKKGVYCEMKKVSEDLFMI